MAIGVSDTLHNYGTNPDGIPVGGDANIYAFMHTLFLQGKNIEALLATEALASAALKAQIIAANIVLDRRIFDAENLIIRTITGIGIGYTPADFYLMTTDAARVAEYGFYKAAVEVNSLNYVLLDGDVVIDGVTSILTNLEKFEVGVSYSEFEVSAALGT